MIIRSTGELTFDDGVRITAHCPLRSLLEAMPQECRHTHPLPMEGWHHHFLGAHPSNYGDFDVDVATGLGGRVEGVFLSHRHSFYEGSTPHDCERRVFHESVIASDLCGQREFSWGEVFCRLDRKVNRDCLIVIYSPFSAVPLHRREVYRILLETERVRHL